MASPAAAQIITIGRSEHPEWTPDEVLARHVQGRDWWSSTKHPGRIWKGMSVFVRYVPGGRLIAHARFDDPKPVYHDVGPEPDLHYRWHPVQFLNETPVAGVYLRDFGITGWRARPGIIGISTPERDAIRAALERADSDLSD